MRFLNAPCELYFMYSGQPTFCVLSSCSQSKNTVKQGGKGRRTADTPHGERKEEHTEEHSDVQLRRTQSPGPQSTLHPDCLVSKVELSVLLILFWPYLFRPSAPLRPDVSASVNSFLTPKSMTGTLPEPQPPPPAHASVQPDIIHPLVGSRFTVAPTNPSY